MIQLNENQFIYKKNRWYYLDEYDSNQEVHTRTIKKEEYDRAIRLKRFIANDEMTVGDKIIEMMHTKGIKQIDLSVKTGIAQSCIADWKHKSTSPAANKIMSICEVLECTPEDILKGAK